jgi:hypothetical protein
VGSQRWGTGDPSPLLSGCGCSTGLPACPLFKPLLAPLLPTHVQFVRVLGGYERHRARTEQGCVCSTCVTVWHEGCAVRGGPSGRQQQSTCLMNATSKLSGLLDLRAYRLFQPRNHSHTQLARPPTLPSLTQLAMQLCNTAPGGLWDNTTTSWFNTHTHSTNSQPSRLGRRR